MATSIKLPDGHTIRSVGPKAWYIHDEDGDGGWLDFHRPLFTDAQLATIPIVEERTDQPFRATPTDMPTLLYLAEIFGWPIQAGEREYRVELLTIV